jgi:hypothetical protein
MSKIVIHTEVRVRVVPCLPKNVFDSYPASLREVVLCEQLVTDDTMSFLPANCPNIENIIVWIYIMYGQVYNVVGYK